MSTSFFNHPAVSGRTIRAQGYYIDGSFLRSNMPRAHIFSNEEISAHQGSSNLSQQKELDQAALIKAHEWAAAAQDPTPFFGSANNPHVKLNYTLRHRVLSKVLPKEQYNDAEKAEKELSSKLALPATDLKAQGIKIIEERIVTIQY